MFATGSWSVVYALDAKTGEELWTYDPEVPGETGPQALLRRRQPRRRGVEGPRLCRHARRPPGRARRQNRQARLGRQHRSTAPSPTRSPARRASSKARSSSATAAPNSACAATSPPTTPTPASSSGASTPSPAIRACPVENEHLKAALPTWKADPARLEILGSRRRRHGVGLDGLRPRPRPALHRHRQRLAVEPLSALARRRRQSLSVVDRRHQTRHRRDGVALPNDARRHLGLHRDPAHDPGRPRDRRADPQGHHAGAEERLLLRARPRDRRVHLGQQLHPRHLGQGPRRQGPPDRRPGDGLSRHAEDGAALAARRPQLAADGVQSADQARLHSGAADAATVRLRQDARGEAGRVEHRPRLRRDLDVDDAGHRQRSTAAAGRRLS